MPYRNKTPKRPSTCVKNPFSYYFDTPRKVPSLPESDFQQCHTLCWPREYDQKKPNRQFRLPQFSIVFLLILLKLDSVPLVSVFSLINHSYCQKNLSYVTTVHDDINALYGNLSAHPTRNLVKQIAAALTCQ